MEIIPPINREGLTKDQLARLNQLYLRMFNKYCSYHGTPIRRVFSWWYEFDAEKNNRDIIIHLTIDCGWKNQYREYQNHYQWNKY